MWERESSYWPPKRAFNKRKQFTTFFLCLQGLYGKKTPLGRLFGFFYDFYHQQNKSVACCVHGRHDPGGQRRIGQ